MMGQHDRSEALFYYFRLEDQVNDAKPITQDQDRLSQPRFQRGASMNCRWRRNHQELPTPTRSTECQLEGAAIFRERRINGVYSSGL